MFKEPWLNHPCSNFYSEIGNEFKEKRKKPFVGIPKDILEKYKNNIQSISDEEVEEIIENFLKK